MAEYLFVLGRASKLCQTELKAVLAREKITFRIIFTSAEILHITTSQSISVDYLIKTLGGTIKIAEVAGVVNNRDEETMVDKLATLIKRRIKEGEPKISFGLNGYNGIRINVLKQWNKEVKERLEKTGLMTRFILPTEGTVLSSVVVKKQKVFEIIIIDESGKLVLARALVVQDFEGWGKRDFGRPQSDPHTGMLPPKVARMMVNLAINHQLATNPLVLDPFCGTGTILAEAMIVGCRVIGSDQSLEAVNKTKRNLDWLISQYSSISGSKYNLLQVDATHISGTLPRGSVDAIVTEPYLGPTIETGYLKLEPQKLKNIILGLEKLYIGCFRDWWKVLAPGGQVVIALPSFRIGEKEFFVKKPIDIRENLGYTLLTGPYQYNRPQAIVIRNIYVLQKGVEGWPILRQGE